MNDSDRLYDLVDRGEIDWYDVAEMCLKYMREDDIAKMNCQSSFLRMRIRKPE